MKNFVKLLTGIAALSFVAPAQAAIPVYSAPGTENSTVFSFTAVSDGDLVAYFAGKSAGFTSVLGALVNGVDTGIQGLNSQTATLGQSLNFGSVSAGDVLTFYINVTNIGQNFFSDPTLNSDGFNHAWSTTYGGGDFGLPAGTFVSFEDLQGGGDKDYNDLNFVFTNAVATSAIPEASTWGMLIVGLGAAGAMLRRRRNTKVSFA